MAANFFALVSVLSLAGSAVIADAALITSWENAGGPSGASYSDIGVTDGSYSLAVSQPSGWDSTIVLTRYNATASALAAELRANPILAIDLTVLMQGVASFQFYLVIQSAQNMSWVQSPVLASVSQSLEKTTVQWDLSSVAITDDPGNWFQVLIVTIQGSAQTVYLDNLRTIAVPEPAGLAVAGFAALPLMRSRSFRLRRRQG